MITYMRAWKFSQIWSGSSWASKKSMWPLFLVSQLWLYLGNSQVSVYRTIGPLVLKILWPWNCRAVFMCLICTRVQICSRVQIYTRVQICTPLRRVHMPINCVHTYIDLIQIYCKSMQFFKEKFGKYVLSDGNSLLSREGSSIFLWQGMWLKRYTACI